MGKKWNWGEAPQKSPVWIDLANKPIERLYVVNEIPSRPDDLQISMSWSADVWPTGLPEKPNPALYLGALEWTWSPMHSRFDSYYLSYTEDHWLVFLHNLQDGGFEQDWTWEWYLYAIANRVPGDDIAISFWLLHDLLYSDSQAHDVDHFHLISDTGILSVGDFKNIGHLVWEANDEAD